MLGGGGVSTSDQILLRLARDVLTDREWQVWVMASLLGYSQRNIAAVLGRSKGTISDTLVRAERKIEEAQHAAHQVP